MTKIMEIKDILYDLTEQYFGKLTYPKTTVIWAEQIVTMPPVPFVTLKLKDVRRNSFIIGDNNERHYNCSTVAEVNLYTEGLPLFVDKNETGNYVNTATSDLTQFANYVESEFALNFLTPKGVDISLENSVRDLSSLENDTRFRYRAMAEFNVTFVEDASNYYGLSATEEQENDGFMDIGYFVEAEIEEIIE